MARRVDGAANAVESHQLTKTERLEAGETEQP
jgi:hypothetical protein